MIISPRLSLHNLCLPTQAHEQFYARTDGTNADMGKPRPTPIGNSGNRSPAHELMACDTISRALLNPSPQELATCNDQMKALANTQDILIDREAAIPGQQKGDHEDKLQSFPQEAA